ncbi:MAG: DNA-3-methyladenine glycosylase [Candidatus Zixiibacteriota bacterium]
MSTNKPAGSKLPRSFYLRPTLTVARELLGKTLVYHHPKGIIAAELVEVEAYIGEEDKACHAAVGRTERNAVMFGNGGFSYVYFIYGMYHCLNVVTEAKDSPAAVLIRAAEPIFGLDIIRANSPASDKKYTNGPGKLCRAFGLDRSHNGLDLCGDTLYLLDTGKRPTSIQTSPRIGIKKSADCPWRFFLSESRYISR